MLSETSACPISSYIACMVFASRHHHCATKKVDALNCSYYLSSKKYISRSYIDAITASHKNVVVMHRSKALAMAVDHSSQSNFFEWKTKSAHYDLHVNFDTKTITGKAELKVKRVSGRQSLLALDTRDLNILGVNAAGQPANFILEEPHKVLGSRLSITLAQEQSAADELLVVVDFVTSPCSSALQWLEAAQTAGGRHPYLFSQCQAIHARSFVPCQDSPSVKFTYTASVSVPSHLKALMSANLASEDGDADRIHPGFTMYKFRQDVPIPSYLLALAVGQLESRSIGPRSRVWSEPSEVDAAANEFQDTAAFLQAGEELAGEYVWGQYDILLLPPSFPYGGMENPCLTFCTPTLIAGDRSLVNVVAHEIAHSWTGNLVSNESWQDFWLNEGWTVMLERKILGRLRGPPTEQFHALQGYLALQDSVNHFGSDHAFTQLVPDLSGGIDPDDSFSKVPYERGFYFLYYLQTLVGGAGSFEPFMRAYIEKFKYGTVNSSQFKEFFCKQFEGHPRLDEIDWETWYYSRGMPPEVNVYDTQLADKAYELANSWHAAESTFSQPRAASSDLQGWTAEQVVAFLDKLGQLRASQPLRCLTTRKMNELYSLDLSRNAEIKASWYKLAIQAGDEEILPLVEQFLQTQGRMKYLRPLYRALKKSSIGSDFAVKIYNVAKVGYHPIAAKMVAADLQV